MILPRKMDYHLHTHHSFDAKQTMDSLCRRAIELGVEEIAITEHIEPGHPDKSCDIPPQYDKWWQDVRTCREKYPQLVIKAGVEIGDNPPCRQWIYDLLDGLDLDFHLLSMHLVDGSDPYLPGFFDHRDQATAYRQYVESKVEGVLNFKDYDAMAHLGYVAKFAPYPKEIRPLTYNYAPDAFDTLFKHLAQEGKAMELNASGYLGMDLPIPGPNLVKRYLELGGEFFTFGSDAHFEERVYLHVERAKEMVRSLGGRWQCGFTKRKMEVYKI